MTIVNKCLDKFRVRSLGKHANEPQRDKAAWVHIRLVNENAADVFSGEIWAVLILAVQKFSLENTGDINGTHNLLQAFGLSLRSLSVLDRKALRDVPVTLRIEVNDTIAVCRTTFGKAPTRGLGDLMADAKMFRKVLQVDCGYTIL